ncbi:MAG: serine hydrolase [Alphaproteobacteria bacterium]|nr:serine hydrolase [Alphaproteobacteria bacterium]
MPDTILPAGDWQQDAAASGWDQKILDEAWACAESIKSSAVMVIEGGRIVARWGEIERRFMCHSIRKSFLSALFGIHIEEGRISRGTTLAELGIDDKEGLSGREKAASIVDLLSARSGIYHPSVYESPWMRSIKELRHSHAPGVFWCYNNWDFNVLGTIFEKLVGRSLFEEFRDRIAVPIGMQDYRYDDERKDGEYVGNQETDHPAYPFRMSSRDLARFGLLFLREGRWGDRQIIPRRWVKESTAPISEAGNAGSYGYMWWVARAGIHIPGVILPEGSYSARGAGGHKMIVVPAHDMVVVHRVDTDIKGREVKTHEFAPLLDLVLAARLGRGW